MSLVNLFLYQPVKGLTTRVYTQWNEVYTVSNINDSNIKLSPITIYYHGNASSSDQVEYMVKQMSSDQYIIPEYPGYRTVPENQSGITEGIVEDVYKLGLWIKQHAIPVHIIGRSIGTGPASLLAAYLLDTSLLKSVHLISPFSSVRKLVDEYTLIFGCLVPPNYFNNISTLKSLSKDTRLYIYHGLLDQVITPSHTHDIVKQIGMLHTYINLYPSMDHQNILSNNIFDQIYKVTNNC